MGRSAARTVFTRRRLALAGLIFILAYASWQGFLWWQRNEPSHRAARNIAAAFENKNTSALWHYTDHGEKDSLGMDRHRFERFFLEYVWPHTHSLERSRDIWETDDRGNVMLTRFYRQGAREAHLMVGVFRTPDGPRANVITPAMLCIFDIKFGAQFEQYDSNVKRFATMLTGFRRDRSQLEKLGVRGTKAGGAQQGLIPFDRGMQFLEAYFERRGGLQTDDQVRPLKGP